MSAKERKFPPVGSTNKDINEKGGLLTVFLELFGTVKIIEKVSRSQFNPPPQVDSAVISVSSIKKPAFKPKEALKILKLAFAGKRKKIKNSLFSSLQISLREAEKIAKAAVMLVEPLTKKQEEKVKETIEGLLQ